jgi:hypothetical protein
MCPKNANIWIICKKDFLAASVQLDLEGHENIRNFFDDRMDVLCREGSLFVAPDEPTYEGFGEPAENGTHGRHALQHQEFVACLRLRMIESAIWEKWVNVGYLRCRKGWGRLGLPCVGCFSAAQSLRWIL